jgi:hypothetical protein
MRMDGIVNTGIFKMSMLARAARFSFVITAALASAAHAGPDQHATSYLQEKVTPEFPSFDTELFNLLGNRANIGTGKNSFNPAFFASFNSLLREAKFAQGGKQLAFLRKRLLSGPEPGPRFLSASGKTYFYYEACQAHACDVSNISLLYETRSKSMRAILLLDGVEEFLGNPTAPEVEMLKRLKSER